MSDQLARLVQVDLELIRLAGGEFTGDGATVLVAERASKMASQQGRFAGPQQPALGINPIDRRPV